MGWLESYYSTDARKKLSPSMVQDGKKYAIVRLMNSRSISFVLVQKSGQHGVTPSRIVFEGVPSTKDFDRMREELRKIDA